MFNKFKIILSKAIFPEHIKCINCGHDLEKLSPYDLCDNCLGKIAFNNGKTCVKCGKNLWAASSFCPRCKNTVTYFDKATAPLIYKGNVKFLVRKFKYNNCPYLSSTFARFLLQAYALSGFDAGLVIPVPMFWTRQKQRGYNHAELLAKEFCKLANLPLDTTNFVRMIDTPQQAKMAKAERESNLDGAFRIINNDIIKGKNILLIDDVMTTCSTMNECAKTLKDGGANKVFCLALSHTETKFYAFKQNISIKGVKSFDKLPKIRYNTRN